MSEELPFAIRDMAEDDRAYVIDSWWRSWRDPLVGDPAQACRSWASWWPWAKGHVLSAIRDSVVIVATPHGMDANLIGWACGQRPGVLHYAVTKLKFRRQGVARALAGALGERIGGLAVHTHWTVGAAAFARAIDLRYDPRAASWQEEP